MGQYYMATVIGNGKINTVYSYSYGSGLKLMEHSYIGNEFVDAVASLIWEQPKKVAWIGDCSDDYYGDAYEQKIPQEMFSQYYGVAWGDDRDEARITSIEERSMSESGLFLVNRTLGVYVDLDEFKKNNSWKEKGAMTDKGWDSSCWSDWCINPLPILTACGNGRGGGDYHDNNPDFDKVGTWEFDEIEITSKRPDAEPVMFSFKEA